MPQMWSTPSRKRHSTTALAPLIVSPLPCIAAIGCYSFGFGLSLSIVRKINLQTKPCASAPGVHCPAEERSPCRHANGSAGAAHHPFGAVDRQGDAANEPRFV